MFTGIIEEVGTVAAVQKNAKSARLTIRGSLIFDDVKLGDSVAVNGVCLTVTEFGNNLFTADVMNETLGRSNLGDLRAGSDVNLERAMRADGRFGGHIVSGHIDGTGVITGMERDDNAVLVTVTAPPGILKYIMEKGSIAIDGISLTVARVSEHSFAVSVIPHTGRETILLGKRIGSTVNLENDVIGKYVGRLLAYPESEAPRKSKLTQEFLINAGF